VSTVTRIAYSKDMNAGKLSDLTELAGRLGALRTEVWNRYGSINGVTVDHRMVRNRWLQDGRVFNIPARLWKETLRDTMADIDTACEAAKVKARKAIQRHTKDAKEQQRLYRLLKYKEWTKDPYLCRIMRKYWHRGHTSVSNQIVLDKQCYATFVKNGQAWLDVSSLKLRKRISVPLNTNVEPTGTIKLILRDGRVEVHYTIKAKVYAKGSGEQVIGIDKGYTEAFVDSSGEHYGQGLGNMLSTESDYLKVKYQRRNKLKAIAESKPHKRDKIEANNLGRKKLNRRKQAYTGRVRTLIFQSAHQLADKASTIACEDLTSPIKSKSFGKNQNRRLSGWVKGIMAEALDTLSHRRRSTVHLVNCAYTSQIDSTTGLLSGKRQGDRFYCESGVVMHADHNAARNVLARLHDPEIDRWTPYRKVRSILLERTESQRCGLTAAGL